jgi:hypothetical protein
MLFLYPQDPLNRRQPDGPYAIEAAVADSQGLSWRLIDHDALVQGDVELAVRRLRVGTPCISIYRGWMMTVGQYGLLHATLEANGLSLINDAAAYRTCHHLPQSYYLLEGHTPRSVWLPTAGEVEMDQIMELLQPFGDSAVIVKDYVKSQKHAWEEACFIPCASDRHAVERIVRRFRDLQGPDLVGGLVFREFVEFAPLGQHSRSGMPLSLEYRLFFLDGRLILSSEYWEEGEYRGEGPPLEHFRKLAEKIPSRFFTMDVAKTRGGDWLVVELGDGQVAGVPDRADLAIFYRQLAGLG